MWRVAGGYVAGCGAVLLLDRLPSLPGLVSVVLLLVALAGVLRSRAFAALALGTLHCSVVAQSRLADRLDPLLEGRSVVARGTVVSVPQVGAGQARFRFAPDRGSGLPQLVELSWYGPEARPLATERYEFELRLRRPRGFANPGGADNDARMLREGIGAGGYVRRARPLGRARASWLHHPVLRTRAAAAEAIRDQLGERPATGIVAGLAVGLQDALSREQWRALARTGTSHLMAISGLHIAMVAGCAAWAGAAWQRARQRRGHTASRRDAALLAGTLAAACYSALAGWSVPTQRTFVMIALGAFALRRRRNTGFADGLALAAACVVAIDPLSLLAPGFWLSFGAVAAIVFATSGALRRPTAVASYLQVQWAVTLGLVPVLAASFGQLSLVSAAVNLVAIPLYTLLIVPAVLLATAAALAAPGAGGPLLHAVAWLIEVSWPVIEVPGRWPLATFPVGALEPLAWLLLVAGTLAALAPLPLQGRLSGLVLICAACLWRPPPLESGAVRLTVLDVGQGLAAVVQTRAHVLVFDAGPSYRSGSDAGRLAVVPFLEASGIRRVDMLVVSHDDDDHKGGIDSVLAALDVRRLVSGPSVRRPVGRDTPPLPTSRCRRGERWRWDEVEFTWLHPGERVHARDNDSSCVLRIRAGEHRLLLTGDIETEAEQELVAAGDAGPVDVVVAPHHGSRTSSSPDFVASTAPRWVIFATGHRNRWGFPARAVVERWEGVGAHPLRTSTSGAIRIEARPGEPLAAPGEWRLDRRRLWMDP